MTSNQHWGPTLPTVEECERRIAESQFVAARPDEYDVEIRVQAARDVSRWTFNRRFALRVQNLEEQLEAPCRCDKCRDCVAADGYERLQEQYQSLVTASREFVDAYVHVSFADEEGLLAIEDNAERIRLWHEVDGKCEAVSMLLPESFPAISHD